MLRRALLGATERFAAEYVGASIEQRKYTNLLWCDNIYLLALSARELARMIIILSDEMANLNLHWK